MDPKGGGAGGNKSRTDLLAAGRKKLQQFRKKKEKKTSGKKDEGGDVDAEAEEGAVKAGTKVEEAVPEPTSPVGLALIAGEGVGFKGNPSEGAERSGVEQCNGEGPSTAESSTVQNAEVVLAQEKEGMECNVQNVATFEQGSLGHRNPGPGDGEGLAIHDTGADICRNTVEGAQQVEMDAVERLPDCDSKENVELQISSRGDVTDTASNQPVEDQQVEVDAVERTPDYGSKENAELAILSEGTRVDDSNNMEEGPQEMESDVSVKPSDGDLQEDVEPTVSAETGVETVHEEELTVVSSHEIAESTARGDIIEEADGVGEEAVQEDPGMMRAREEAVITDNLSLQSKLVGTVDKLLYEEKVDPALLGSDVSHGIMLDHFEDIQRHLYLTTLLRDFHLLQLGEEADLNSAVTQRSSDEVSKLQVLLKEAEESKLAVSEELWQCRHELSDMNAVKGDHELIVASLKQEVGASSTRCEQLETELHSSKENMQHTLNELADSRAFLDVLQKENLELTANLTLEKEARKEVEEEREYLSGENKKLSLKLSELELILASVKEEMNAGSSRCENLEHELHSSKANIAHTLNDLINCRALLETSQQENLELTASFAFEKEAIKKLEEDNEYRNNENRKLLSDLSELNDKLHLSYHKHKQLETHAREMETYFGQLTEQLIEEILCASISADIYQSDIKELDGKFHVVLSQGQNAVHQENELRLDSSEITVETSERTISCPGFVGHGDHECSLHSVNKEDLGNSGALQLLKGHLVEAKGDLHDLEKLVQRICSRSDGRVLVSKLIKSFESQGNQDDTGMSEGERDDLHKLTQDMICRLGEKLKDMTFDLAKNEEYVAELCNRGELLTKFEIQYEAERQKTENLHIKMDELARKLSNYKDTIDQLHNQLAIAQQDADNNAGRLISQTELLQKDVKDRISFLENERGSLTNLLTEVTEKLSSLRGLVFPIDLGESEGLSSRALGCVDMATKSIQSLHEKLEAAQIDNVKLNTSLAEIEKAHSDVQERNDQASGIVKKMCNALQELLCDSFGNLDESDVGCNAEEPIEGLFGRYERLIEHLQNLLHDRLSFSSKNADLESKLLSKCQELEEISIRYNSLTKNMNDICLLNEELQLISSSKNSVLDELHERCLGLADKLGCQSVNQSSSALHSVTDSCEVVEKFRKEQYILTALLPCIEEGVASYIEKFENAVEQIRLSKICLQEANIFDQISFDKWSLSLPTLIKEDIMPKFCDLLDRMEQLTALNIELETEVPALRDGMKKLEEALGISRTELYRKVSELEQSEQKLSSVKEKLSIAVAKGKGLIVQRDGLKQSLLEKTGELERLSQELQSKEALLQELEAKLKSYTEADRIEALESELSYIRNSATALRDSFLLKDSVLQRIEEVLEDLDLPEHFHSRDIVEKIELLSKMAVSASFSLPDGDKRSSMDGHSDSDAAMDGLNDEQNSNSNPELDELKNKYDGLHRRFYELAEQNNVLEQSLVERNNLILKWEEVLAQISIPPQFRMLEPEDKIAWLGDHLAELEQERDALQLKIEHLEDSSEMLIVDLEESHKRISELSAEVVAIKAEKDFFSESLEKLRFDFLGLSEKAVQDEFVRNNLRKDLAELQEKLAEKTEESKHYYDVEVEISKLLDVVRDALQDSSNTEIPSGSSAAILNLGKLLRKLLDNYEALLSESARGNVAEKEIHLEETELSNDNSTSKTGTEDMEMVSITLNNELEHVRNSLALVEQQRDKAVGKAQSLKLEVEALHAQINQYQEGSADQMQKHQSLLLEIESVGKQRDNLQEQLNQEEQKCASLREKLNVAVRKGKGLVQHRDSLKQTIEEMNTVIENLKNERRQHIESLESEKSSLMGRLAENEKSLHDTNQYLSGLLNALGAMDIARDLDMDLITKIEKIAAFCHSLQATVVSSENEVKKSKRATELLLAELNETQERADNLQEELVKAEAALSESSRQKNVIESARADAVRHFEHHVSVQAQATKKQLDHLKDLNSITGQLREVCFELSHHLINIFSKDADLVCYMESFMKSSGKWMDGANMVDIPITSKHLLSNNISSKKAHISNAPLELPMDNSDESQIVQHLAIACHSLSDCVKDCNDLRRSIDEHGFLVDQKATELFDVMANLQNRFTSQNNELESLRGNIVGLQSEIKEKEDEVLSIRRNMSLLYEACTSSVAEIEAMAGVEFSSRSYFNGQNYLFADDHIRSVADQLAAAIKSTQSSNEGNSKELKATIFELQQEIQEKDIQISTISEELTSHIREAESTGKQLSVELEDARMKISNLEKQVEVLLNQKKALATQVAEVKDNEAVASELHGRIKELTDELSRKEQEIEGLMQALDEEEKEIEALENRGNDLEQVLQEKEFALKSLEVSRTKAVTKLATTVDKFDELHILSESLLAEVENLQSQLQERDSEISFLRQEVTRSTNEVLTTEEINKKYLSQIHDFIKWLETALLQFGVHYESTDDYDFTQIPVYMDILDKKIGSLVSESDELRVTVQSKDSLLLVERTKMEELLRKSEVLEASLSQKDTQIGLLRRERTSGQLSRVNLPGTSEIEQVNEKVSPGAVVTQIRGPRKVNNDQVAIDVNMDKDRPLDDEDDDKAHGFKSLTMSHIVPKFTRPISDRIDGMWVSGDRLLMRQPTLRLGVLIYWIVLHALLASFI